MGLTSLFGSLVTSMYVKSTLVVSCLCLFAYWQFYKKRSDRPPGPVPLPFIGNLNLIGRDPGRDLLKLVKRFGSIVTVYFGSKEVVVLGSYDMIREALVKKGHAFAGRPSDFLDLVTNGGGVLTTEGETWSHQRKFANKVFKDLKVWDSVFQDKIHAELSILLETFHKHCNASFSPRHFLQQATANIIFSVMLGFRFKYDDERHMKMMKLNRAFTEHSAILALVTAFPVLKYLPDRFLGFSRLKKSMDTLRGMYGEHIMEHKDIEGESNDDLSRDMATMYMQKGKELREANGCDTISGPNLEQMILECVGAGTYTTAATLTYAMIYMAQNPSIQKKIQAEIDSVIGRDRLPLLEDRPKMPYTEACILETQRLADLAPLSVMRKTVEDVELCGHRIPKGTYVTPLLHAVHRDEKVWEKPYEFHPSHFLKEDMTVRQRKELIPFSIGRRSCLGEPMAKMEIFLFFCGILQNFELSFEDIKQQTFKEVVGMIRMPEPIDILLKKRS